MQHEHILKFFAKYIESELGIVYSPDNYFQLENRLEEIAKVVDVPDLENLFLKAKSGITGQFKQLLLDVATNNETSFFRDTKAFRAIEAAVLKAAPSLVGDGGQLRVWSAASSTGQEALSVAITIKEFNAKNKANLDFSILATDISERVLEKARSGVYTQLQVQRGLPAPYLIKYFKKDQQDNWTASPELLKHVSYETQNLKAPFLFSKKFHLILCRNVLIYQNVESKTEILARLKSVLAPGGYLILGAGETLLGLSNEFEQQVFEGAILYRNKSTSGLAA